MKDFVFTKNYPIGMFGIEEAVKKNRVICHPNEYKKFAESGIVKTLTDAGIEVIQSDLLEEGKQITTGDLACAVFNKWRIEK